MRRACCRGAVRSILATSLHRCPHGSLCYTREAEVEVQNGLGGRTGRGPTRGGRVAGIDGNWAIDVVTLAGSRRYDLALASAGTTLTGTSVGDTGPIAIREGSFIGDTASFRIDFLAPLPMTLRFVLKVVGDRLVGTAQVGPYPPTNVVGVRMP